MIDFVKITVPNFSGNFDKCTHIRKLISRTRARLYNRVRKDSKAYLDLDFDEASQTLTIENSLRKWYLGDYSLIDLTSETFVKAIEKIANLLNIPPNELANGTVTQCEIGLNIRTKIPCSDIVPAISKYSTLKWYRYADETVGFKGENKEAKLYNKPVELKNRKKRDKIDKRFVEMYDVLERHGYNFLRIEFTLYDRKSFADDGLGHISTIGDLAANYGQLYDFWAREVSRIVVVPKLLFDKNMTWKEYMIARIMSVDGFGGFEDECVARCTTVSSKSRLLNEGIAVICKYADLDEYNKTELRRDILKNINRIKRKEKKIDSASLIKNLWGRTVPADDVVK